MLITPAIQALLDDPAALRAQQEIHARALAGWRECGEGQALLEDFSAFAAGQALSALGALARLFDGSDAAGNTVRGLVRALLPALAEAPCGQVPLRHHIGAAGTTVMLAREGEASLSLLALDGAGVAAAGRAVSAAFAPAEEWDVVVAGTGVGRLIEHRGAPGLAAHHLDLGPGLALGRDAAREALVVDRVDGTLVFLRLRRGRPGPSPVRECALEDGRLLHQATASARESRHEMAVAVLGAMRRIDAVPTLGAIARDRRHGDALRWQAVRQGLALDTLAGFRTLAALACGPDDPLAAPAGALRAQLIEHHPVLAGVEPCPA